MKAMQWTRCVLLCAVIALLLAGPAASGESASREECVEMCKKAAAFMKEAGPEKALAMLNDPQGPYVWKDSYVFAIDFEKKLNLAHPVKPALNNQPWVVNVKDTAGKMFFAEFMQVAETTGEGWVEYMWPKPGESAPSPKATFIYRVPGTPYAMGAGVYE